MYTQCPHCDAIFPLTTAQLKAANGEVRCGQCLTVFNALNHLSDQIPASITEQPQKESNDTGNIDPWADDNSAASSLTESTINGAAAETAVDNIASAITGDEHPTDVSFGSSPLTTDSHFETNHLETSITETVIEASPEPTAETPLESAEADIFSEVIAEASQHSLPTEEMDRFEEFLSTDTPASESDDSDTGAELSREFTEEFTEEINGFNTASVARQEEHNNEESSIEESSIEELSIEELSTDDFNNAAFEANEPEAVQFGDTETATAELDIEMHADTADEFAEFDEYSPADDELESGNTTEATNNFDLDTENEVIIIEDADLEPITSKAYTDKPESRVEDKSKDNNDVFITTTDNNNAGNPTDGATEQNVEEDDFSELEEAAAEIAASEIAATETQPPSSQETLHIPALIMEDLHAARAEQLRPSNTPWVIGNLVLMLTLVLQVVYFSRDELAKDASLRPWLVQMCQIANCTLTQPYDIKQIDIIGREVRTHPSARKALIASTTLINNASFVQPFPLLTMVFSDINGKPLAQRRFTPREYLSHTTDLNAGMTPDMPVRIELELVDPGKAAVNYEFHAEIDPRNTRPLT